MAAEPSFETLELKPIAQEACVAIGGLKHAGDRIWFAEQRAVLDDIHARFKPIDYSREGSDLVGLYLSEIGQYPLLDKQQVTELAKMVEVGVQAHTQLELALAGEAPTLAGTQRQLRKITELGAEAKNTLFTSNLRLVVSIAKKYPRNESLELLDLISEGNLGLEHAIDKFDWRKGFTFSTYATFWIRQAIGRAIEDKASQIRLPNNIACDLRTATKARDQEEIPLDAKMSAYDILVHPISLFAEVGDDNESFLYEFVADKAQAAPESSTLESADAQVVNQLLGVLRERERSVLRMRFGLDNGERRTLEEVGQHFGVTRERVRQIEKLAIEKLRSHTSRNGIDIMSFFD